MAWTNLTYVECAVLTAAKMTQLQGNLTALAEQHSGSPLVSFPNSAPQFGQAAPAAPTLTRMYRQSMPKAWALVWPQSGTIEAQFNVSCFETVADPGRFKFWLSTSLSNGLGAVEALASHVGGQRRYCTGYMQTRGTALVNVTDEPSASFVNPDRLNVIILGD